MTKLEERLRGELHAESETITPDSIVDLRLPPFGRRGVVRWHTRRPTGTRRSLAWARPLAAAAAVVAVAVGTVVAVRSIPGTSPAGSPGSYSGFPANYASIQTSTYGNGDQSKYGPTIMIVRTATGATLTKVGAPNPYNAFIQVSSDAAGNTFVFAVARVTRQSGEMEIDDAVPFKFLMLRITADGHTRVSTLPLSLPVSWYTGRFTSWSSPHLAVSPDGSKVALSYGGEGTTAVVQMMTLATRSTRTWTLPHATWAPAIEPQGAWTANGRTLTIRSAPGLASFGGHVSVRLLDTIAPGSSLASAKLVSLQGASGYAPLFMTPGGTELISALPSGLLVVYSARTGAQVRTLAASVPFGQNLYVFWSTPSGSKLVLFQEGPKGPALGVLTGNGFKADGAPLPHGHAYERLSHALSDQGSLQL